MFGETVSDLILYLAPKNQSDLDTWGFTSTKLEKLLQNDAAWVFSYLPGNVRRLYGGRVYRLILVDFAQDGQTSVSKPFQGITHSNIVGYKNPSGSLEDFRGDHTPLTVTENSGNLEFSALESGDRLIIDFDIDLDPFYVPVLSQAVIAITAARLLRVFSENLETADIFPRVDSELTPVQEFLRAVNAADRTGRRVVIKELDFDFWDGDFDFSEVIDSMAADKIGKLDI
jgi:hypothetical protein